MMLTSAPLPMELQNWGSVKKKPRAKVATSGLRAMDERRTMSRHWMASCGKSWPPPPLQCKKSHCDLCQVTAAVTGKSCDCATI